MHFVYSNISGGMRAHAMASLHGNALHTLSFAACDLVVTPWMFPMSPKALRAADLL
jgi:hypothetical protein